MLVFTLMSIAYPAESVFLYVRQNLCTNAGGSCSYVKRGFLPTNKARLDFYVLCSLQRMLLAFRNVAVVLIERKCVVCFNGIATF